MIYNYKIEQHNTRTKKFNCVCANNYHCVLVHHIVIYVHLIVQYHNQYVLFYQYTVICKSLDFIVFNSYYK